ncbi:MAG TPA: hypothetical protein VIG44_00165, partial [Thermomicrobiales bacterium]
LRDPLRDLIPEEARYARIFDRFEYLRFLIGQYDRHLKVGYGRFIWRGGYGSQDDIVNEINEEFERSGANWAPLRAGLFGGSVEAFQELIAAVLPRLHEQRAGLLF